VPQTVIFELSGVENEGVGPKMSILVLIVTDTDVFAFLPISAIFTNFIALGHNLVLPDHFRCLKLSYSSSAGSKMGV
jgi:hypothetical protein